jgi:hypothetical protein
MNTPGLVTLAEGSLDISDVHHRLLSLRWDMTALPFEILENNVSQCATVCANGSLSTLMDC